MIEVGEVFGSAQLSGPAIDGGNKNDSSTKECQYLLRFRMSTFDNQIERVSQPLMRLSDGEILRRGLGFSEGGAGW
jgi:hypothetical protein